MISHDVLVLHCQPAIAPEHFDQLLLSKSVRKGPSSLGETKAQDRRSSHLETRVPCCPSWRGFTAAPLNSWLLRCGFNYRSYLPSERMSQYHCLSQSIDLLPPLCFCQASRMPLFFCQVACPSLNLNCWIFPQSGSSRRPYRFCSLLYTCCVVNSQLMLVGRINKFKSQVIQIDK